MCNTLFYWWICCREANVKRFATMFAQVLFVIDHQTETGKLFFAIKKDRWIVFFQIITEIRIKSFVVFFLLSSLIRGGDNWKPTGRDPFNFEVNVLRKRRYKYWH